MRAITAELQGMEYVQPGGLRIAYPLHEFINTEVIPGSEVAAAEFWQGFGHLIHDFAPRNGALLIPDPDAIGKGWVTNLGRLSKLRPTSTLPPRWPHFFSEAS